MKKFKKSCWAMALLFMTLMIVMPAMAEDIFERELEKETEAIKLVHDVNQGGYGIVSTSDLKQWIDSGKDMVIIDAMPYDAYKEKHIPGAAEFLFPIPDMKEWNTKETDNKTEEDYVKLLGANKEKTIVVYCGFVKCTRSHNAAVWARSLGYKNVYRYPGGIYAWQGAKYPTEAAK
jgi:thiosulfate/3-mercaptopyruvate sulfurtransferase